MSPLFRTKPRLTLGQLLPAWAGEIAEGKTNADRIEHDLRHFLIEDIVNGRFDDAGPPLEDGRRSGLRLITPENQVGYLEGAQVSQLLISAADSHTAFSYVSHRILVMKEAVLDFARRHELPPPSWWTDASEPNKQAPSSAGPQLGPTMPARIAADSTDAAMQKVVTDHAGPQRTGAPGRPTSMHLVEAEYHARWERGEVQESLAEEAEALSRWLVHAHPTAPKVTPKTIENRLREEHRRRLAGPQN